jgi:hypothetical protein
MSESSSSKSIVVIFMPFDGSPKDFAAKFREWAPSAEASALPAPARQAEIEGIATETMPLWMWFVPNPRPNDSRS